MGAQLATSADIERLAALVREARSVVALTGAGISVPSGIPDFRSPGTGLWEKVDPMEVAHIDAFHRDPEGVPRCASCSGPLMPDVVLFGELRPAQALERAQRLCAGAQLLLCIGSSLEVHPVAGLPELTLAAGGAVAIVTQGPTPLDHLAAVRLRGDVVAELQALLAALGLSRP